MESTPVEALFPRMLQEHVPWDTKEVFVVVASAAVLAALAAVAGMRHCRHQEQWFHPCLAGTVGQLGVHTASVMLVEGEVVGTLQAAVAVAAAAAAEELGAVLVEEYLLQDLAVSEKAPELLAVTVPASALAGLKSAAESVFLHHSLHCLQTPYLAGKASCFTTFSFFSYISKLFSSTHMHTQLPSHPKRQTRTDRHTDTHHSP